MIQSERYRRIINMVLNIALAVCMIAIFIIGIYFSADYKEAGIKKEEDYLTGWQYAISGEKIEEPQIRVMSGESVEIKRQLRNQLTDDYIFFFYDPGFDTTAYINGVNIYDKTKTPSIVIGQEIGKVWRRIELDEKMEGQNLTIVFYNNTDDTLLVDLNKMYCGTESYFFGVIIRASIGEIIASLICFIMAAVTTVIALGLKRNNYNIYTKRLMVLVALTVLVGIWVIADGSMLQFVFASAATRYMIDKFTLILIPLVLNHYFELIVDRNVYLFNAFGLAYKFAVWLCLMMYGFGVVHISQTIFLVHVFSLMEALLIGHTALGEYVQKKDLNSLGMIISFPIIIIFITSAIYAFYFSHGRVNTSMIIGYGYILFVSVLFMTQFRQIRQSYDERKQADKYELLLDAFNQMDEMNEEDRQ